MHNNIYVQQMKNIITQIYCCPNLKMKFLSVALHAYHNHYYYYYSVSYRDSWPLQLFEQHFLKCRCHICQQTRFHFNLQKTYILGKLHRNAIKIFSCKVKWVYWTLKFIERYVGRHHGRPSSFFTVENSKIKSQCTP